MNFATVTWGLLAQGASDASQAVQVNSVWDFVVKGGTMMIPIGIASLVALTIVIERAISLRKKKIAPPDFLPQLKEHLGETGRETEPALAYCRDNGSPLANIIAAGLKRIDAPVERMEKQVEEAGQREVLKLRKYLRVLTLIASIAPLMGLLGTIFGMIRAFQTVALSGQALGRTELLAKGIYEAMITTAAGLMVAIPILIAHHWIAAKVQRLVLDIDQVTCDFIEDLADKRRAVPTLPRLQRLDGKPIAQAEARTEDVTSPAMAPQ